MKNSIGTEIVLLVLEYKRRENDKVIGNLLGSKMGSFLAKALPYFLARFFSAL